MKIEEVRYTATISLSNKKAFIKEGSQIPKKESDASGTVRDAMDILALTDGDEIEIIVRRKK